MKKNVLLKTISLMLMGSLVLTACSLGKTETKTPEESSNEGVAKDALNEKAEGTTGADLINWDNMRNMTESDGSTVYMTNDISAEGLVAIYEALGFEAKGNVAVKISTGEPPASNYLDPSLMKDLVNNLDATIVECNTAYAGPRSSTAMHYQVAEDHGFTAIAPFVILDEDGSVSIPVSGGTYLTEDLVGSKFFDYDTYVILSHFKGHAMAGFGGAIKNISIGLGSQEGKFLIHTHGESTSEWVNDDQDPFLMSMAEAGSAVSTALNNGENIVYINVMNRLSIDCDCDGFAHEPDMHDIGILASTDPVALDQACVDLIYASEDDSEALIERIEELNGELTLEHAEKIGLGSRTYHIVHIDE